jgi:hypothetical protein
MTQNGGEAVPTPGMAARVARRGAGNLTEAVAVLMWPTPTTVTDTGGAALCKWGGAGARAKLRTMVTPEEMNGALNPTFVEFLMGLPKDWSKVD